MDKLRSLRVARAIAQYGSLTAAAQRLNVSTPTVVRVLASLEADIGFTLFTRTTRRVTATPEGEIYLARCGELLDELERTEDELSGDSHNPRGPVTVTAPVMFGQHHVSAALLELQKQYPGITIRLILTDRIIKLSEEAVDMAVRIGLLEDSTLRALRVGEVRQVLCASPELIARTGIPTSPADLEQLPCISIDGNTGGRSWPFRDPGGDPIRVRIEPIFACNLVGPAIEACLRGHGFSLFLDYQVADEIALGRLVPLLGDAQPPALPVHIVRRQEPAPSTRAMLTVEALAKHLRKACAGGGQSGNSTA